jgi:uncharacterized protein YjbI with pentapeptide repeats
MPDRGKRSGARRFGPSVRRGRRRKANARHRVGRTRVVRLALIVSLTCAALWVVTRPGSPWIWPLVGFLGIGGAALAVVGWWLRVGAAQSDAASVGGELASEAGIALATSAAVGAVLFLATQSLEANLFERDTRADNVRFVREVATEREPSIKPFAGLELREAQLAGLDLSNARLSDADLTAADLTRADLRNAELISADAADAILTSVNLRNADLTHIDLSGADLDGADLSPTYLSGADLSGASLRDASLTGSDLHDANLTEADLRHADLTGTDLSGADLSHADLRGARLVDAFVLDGRVDLTGADLTGADLTGAFLADVDLADADLCGANLSGAVLHETDDDRVAYDRRTVWPQDVEPPRTPTPCRHGSPDDADRRGGGV